MPWHFRHSWKHNFKVVLVLLTSTNCLFLVVHKLSDRWGGSTVGGAFWPQSRQTRHFVRSPQRPKTKRAVDAKVRLFGNFWAIFRRFCDFFGTFGNPLGDT